jgi:hypothetical protein
MVKKFHGPLGKRIKPRIVGLISSDETRSQKAQEWASEDFAKLRLLCKHYGIEENEGSFLALSLALARDFVEGFKEEEPVGRKTKWTDLNKGVLVVEVERLAVPGSKSKGVKWACAQLAKQRPWRDFVSSNEGTYSSDPAEALRKTYFGFRMNPWARIATDAFRYHQCEGTVAAWNKFVIDAVDRPHIS